MVRHIVWWTLKPHAVGRTADENVMHIQKASAMLHGYPTVHVIEVSNKVQPSTTVPAKVVLCSSHDNMDDFQAFTGSDVYKQFMDMVGELADSVQCIDYVVDRDPNLPQ